jgi:glycosyltransferase involved in cell wall biosynthesis
MKKTEFTTINIMPGYIFDVESIFSTKLIEMSKFCSGMVVGLSLESGSYSYGNFDVKLMKVNSRVRVFNFFLLLFHVFIEAYKLNKQDKVDLIVCYDPLKSGVIGYLLSKIFRCKLIVEINGVYNSPVIIEYLKSSSKLKRFLFPKIQQFIVNNADGVKCLFDGQLDGFDQSKIKHQSTYLNYTDIQAIEYNDIDSKIILSIGFPLYIKGIDLLIEAFKKIFIEYPDWRLEIYGHFTNSELDCINKISSPCKSIHVFRPVPFSKIPNIIDNCEIFVLPSRSEAMGRVLLEAMARSKPRIGSNVDGIPGVINNGKDGYLFDTNDIEDLTKKLRLLMNSKEKRKAFGEAGYKRFREQFTVEQYCASTKNFYEDVISKV